MYNLSEPKKKKNCILSVLLIALYFYVCKLCHVLYQKILLRGQIIKTITSSMYVKNFSGHEA